MWQMELDGCSRGAIRHAIKQTREVHDGVHLSGHAWPTPWQLWKAAEITTPDTRLSMWSGGTFWGLRDRDRMPTTVTRPGSGGPELVPPRKGRIGSLMIYRSNAYLDTDTVVDRGIKALSPSRNVLDLLPKLSDDRAKRLVRDALRTKAVQPVDLRATVAKHHGRRSVARLRVFTDLYSKLPADEARSDPEIVALELIAAAGLPVPELNVLVAGEEADLVYWKHKKIVELDGPQFHQFPEEDERKQRLWEAAGFVVERLPTDDVYNRPHLLLALVPHVHL